MKLQVPTLASGVFCSTVHQKLSRLFNTMVTFSKTVARIFNTPRLYELAKDILEGNRTNAQNLILVFYKDDPLETFEALFQVKISRFGPEDSLCLIIYNGRHTNNKNRDSSTRYPSTA